MKSGSKRSQEEAVIGASDNPRVYTRNTKGTRIASTAISTAARIHLPLPEKSTALLNSLVTLDFPSRTQTAAIAARAGPKLARILAAKSPVVVKALSARTLGRNSSQEKPKQIARKIRDEYLLSL